MAGVAFIMQLRAKDEPRRASLSIFVINVGDWIINCRILFFYCVQNPTVWGER